MNVNLNNDKNVKAPLPTACRRPGRSCFPAPLDGAPSRLQENSGWTAGPGGAGERRRVRGSGAPGGRLTGRGGGGSRGTGEGAGDGTTGATEIMCCCNIGPLWDSLPLSCTKLDKVSSTLHYNSLRLQ